MGQKTNPKAFRLVTTQKHFSEWYSTKLYYPTLIHEDFQIREKIQKDFGEFLCISNIEISRPQGSNIDLTLNDYSIKDSEPVNITVHSLYPRAKDMYRKFGKQTLGMIEGSSKIASLFVNSKGILKKLMSFVLQRKIRNFIRFFQRKTGKQYSVFLKFIKNPFEDAVLIAKFIGEQLQKRMPFRRAMKQTFLKVENTSIKGIKIQVSGRLNGVEIARSEWKRNGQVPLHTLRAKIDYTHHYVETVYGIIGIKIWLFRGNELQNS